MSKWHVFALTPFWTLFTELGHSYNFFKSCIIINCCELELSVAMSRLQYWGSIYLYDVSPLQHTDYILCRCAGTERCNEAVERLKGKFDLVVNIQGDEPLIDPVIIDGIVLALQVFIWLANKAIKNHWWVTVLCKSDVIKAFELDASWSVVKFQFVCPRCWDSSGLCISESSRCCIQHCSYHFETRGCQWSE